MHFNRDASTTIKTPKNCPACPKRGIDSATWKGMFEAARLALGANVSGIVSIKGGRAWFQIVGDSTPYSIMLTDAELAMFHV